MSAPGQEGRGAARPGPVFLERTGYRRRRMVDAARMIPVLGAALWAVPLLWTRGGMNGSGALLYIFGIWLGLVVATALLARALGRGTWEEESGSGEARDRGEAGGGPEGG